MFESNPYITITTDQNFNICFEVLVEGSPKQNAIDIHIEAGKERSIFCWKTVTIPTLHTLWKCVSARFTSTGTTLIS
jgi:Zn finger protein HypA/HybF involved in hydrogenase expression